MNELRSTSHDQEFRPGGGVCSAGKQEVNQKTCLRFSSGALIGAGGLACSSPCEAMLGGARLTVVAGGGFGT